MMAKEVPYSFFSKIAGVTHENPDRSSRQDTIRRYCKPGMSLLLIRDPDNKFDKNAIGLWLPVIEKNTLRMVQVGYLGSEVAREVAQHLVRGGAVWVFVSKVTGGTKDQLTLGVNIKVTVDKPE